MISSFFLVSYNGHLYGSPTEANRSGSENVIGGQAFLIKLRPTAERSPSAMVLEPPYTLNGTADRDPSLPPRWRHMKLVLALVSSGNY